MFKYSDQVLPPTDTNPGWVGNGQDMPSDINDVTAANEADISDPGFAPPPTGPMTQPGTNFNANGLGQGPDSISGNPEQVAQQNEETSAGSNVTSSWNREAYRRVLATDGDLYNQGMQDRLQGKEMDEALANLSDDYRWGYEQGGFYDGTLSISDAPPFEHEEMRDGSDDITRNPVATRRHDFSDRTAEYDWEGMKPPRGDAAQEGRPAPSGQPWNQETIRDHPMAPRHEPEEEEEEERNPLFPPRQSSRYASDPFGLENDNTVIEGDDPVLDESHNNNQLDPGPYDDAEVPTEEDDYTLEKDPEDRGMNSSNPTTTGDSGDYNEGLTTVGSIITSSRQVLADASWFRDSSESIYDRLDVLQTCINNLKRTASSNQLDDGEFNRVAGLLHEGAEQFDQLQRIASEYVDFDTQEYLQSLPGGVVASNYASLDRDGDIGPDDGSFLYREAAKIRAEVADLDIENYTKVSARLYVEDQSERLLTNPEAFREASLYFVFNDTLPILDSVKRAAVIDDFMTEAERTRREAVKQIQKREAALSRTASTHKQAWVEDLDSVFNNSLWF